NQSSFFGPPSVQLTLPSLARCRLLQNMIYVVWGEGLRKRAGRLEPKWLGDVEADTLDAAQRSAADGSAEAMLPEDSGSNRVASNGAEEPAATRGRLRGDLQSRGWPSRCGCTCFRFSCSKKGRMRDRADHALSVIIARVGRPGLSGSSS